MCEVTDFKPFVHSNDFEVSKAFYECIGFTVNWDDGEVCEIDPMETHNKSFRYVPGLRPSTGPRSAAPLNSIVEFSSLVKK